MVSGKISPSDETDDYSLRSNADQYVTVVLIAEKSLDTFALEIKDENGFTLARSKSSVYLNWIQMPVLKGQKLKASVSLVQSLHFLSNSYRLIVVGSTNQFRTTDITGPHQIR